MKNLKIHEVAYHRNGVAGEGFHVVTFADDGEEMIGVVFFAPLTKENEDEYRHAGNPRVAVFDRDLLGQGVIAFGENSHRGDHYADALRVAIIAHA